MSPRRPLRPRPALAGAALALALAGCGNKGDLYLVEPGGEPARAPALPGLEVPTDVPPGDPADGPAVPGPGDDETDPRARPGRTR